MPCGQLGEASAATAAPARHVTPPLRGRHRREPGAAGVAGELHRLRGGLQLGLFEAAGLDARTRRQRQQASNVEHDAAVDFGFAAAAYAAEAQAGIAQAACLHQVGLRCAQFGNRGFQCRAVHLRDAHGVVGRQRLGQQQLDLLIVVGAIPGEGGGLPDARSRQARDVVHAAVGGQAGAAAKQQGAGRRQQR
jgi:hypothetical protein